MLGYKDALNVYTYMRNDKEKNSVVLSRFPVIVYFYSGYKSIPFPYSSDLNTIEKTINERGVKYILVDSISEETPKYLSPVIIKNSDNFKLVYRSGRCMLLELKDKIL